VGQAKDRLDEVQGAMERESNGPGKKWSDWVGERERERERAREKDRGKQNGACWGV